MSKIRIVIADDHVVLRDGLRTLLNSQPDMQVVGEAGDTAEALIRVKETEPKILCLDLSMPGGGASVIEEVTQLGVRVVVYSMHDDPAYLRTALAAGAMGYVLKSSSPSTLLTSLRLAASGQQALDPKVQDSAGPAPSEGWELSKREKEVFEYLIRGHTNQVIADLLFVSVKTIETYRARIREKTGLQTRADFIQYGVSTGRLSPKPPNTPSS